MGESDPVANLIDVRLDNSSDSGPKVRDVLPDDRNTTSPTKYREENMFEDGMIGHKLWSEREEGSEECLVIEEATVMLALAKECSGKAVLDTACTNDVAGRRWVEDYIERLPDDDRERVKKYKGGRTFKFGGGERLVSKTEMIVPGWIGEQRIMLKFDVVDADLPLLLSLNTIKMAETILDTKNDEAFMLDNLVKLGRTETGHYTVDLIKGESQWLGTASLDNKADWKRALTKHHEQFAHPPHKQLK